jgi:hypothetical protein
MLGDNRSSVSTTLQLRFPLQNKKQMASTWNLHLVLYCVWSSLVTKSCWAQTWNLARIYIQHKHVLYGTILYIRSVKYSRCKKLKIYISQIYSEIMEILYKNGSLNSYEVTALTSLGTETFQERYIFPSSSLNSLSFGYIVGFNILSVLLSVTCHNAYFCIFPSKALTRTTFKAKQKTKHDGQIKFLHTECMSQGMGTPLKISDEQRNHWF